MLQQAAASKTYIHNGLITLYQAAGVMAFSIRYLADLSFTLKINRLCFYQIEKRSFWRIKRSRG